MLCGLADSLRSASRVPWSCISRPTAYLRRPRTSTATACRLRGRSRPGSLGCVLRRRPVPVCRLLDQWREKRDVPRYRRLVNLEDVGPYLFDYVLPQISAGDDKCLPQGQLAWASYSFIPGFPEQFVRAVHQFVELLFVQS